MPVNIEKSKTKNVVQAILGIGTILLSISILAVLIYPQRQTLITYDWHIHWPVILLTFTIFSLNLFVVALIWAWIMNTLGGKLPLLEHLRVYLISHLARRLPGTVWYVASRAVLYKQGNISAKLTMVASGMELLVMIVSGIIISLIFAVSIMASYGVGYGWFMIFAFVGGMLLHPRIVRFVLQKSNVDLPEVFRFRMVIQWIAAYIVAWVLGGIVLYGVGNIIVEIPPINIPYLIGCWSIIGVVSTTLFFLPSNLGITEVGLSLLLTMVVPAPLAVVVALLARVLLIAFEIFWASIIFFVDKKKVIHLRL